MSAARQNERATVKHYRKLKIVIFYQYFTTTRGAWSTRVYEFARRWVQAGHSVTVISSVYDKSDLTPRGWLDRENIEGINVAVINLKLSNKHRKLRRIISFGLYALFAAVIGYRTKADVAIASSGPITVCIPVVLLSFFRRLKYVFEARDLWPDSAIETGYIQSIRLQRLAHWFERLCYRRASGIVPASVGIAEEIERRVPGKRTVIIPNASDNAYSQSVTPPSPMPAWAQGKTLFVYAGTLGLIDDCGNILKAAKELLNRGNQDLCLVLVGDGRERAELEALKEREGLGNVHFTGLLPKMEALGWIKAARASVLTVKNIPYIKSASPNKLFDSFALGVPVVHNMVGWVQELFEREGCGITVPNGDAEAMADAFELLSRDDKLHRRMSENALRLARTDFDRDLLSERYLDFIHSVCDED